MIDDLLNTVIIPIKTKNEEDVARGMKEALNETKGEPSILLDLFFYIRWREKFDHRCYTNIFERHMSRTLKDMLDKGVEAAETEFAMDIFLICSDLR